MRFAAGLAALAAVGVMAFAALGSAAGPPPPPKATNGHAVTVLARGVNTPTAFAFAGSTVFVAGFGDEEHPKITGGVYVVKGGKAVKLKGSPAHALGLAYSGGTLYLSSGFKILAWSGWNGTAFAKSRTVVTAPKPATFNGIALGPDGKIYAGISLGDGKKADYTAGTTPYANDVVAIDRSSGAITVVAKGLRQPWQLAFVPGHKGPLVSDLGQENLGKKHPPDYIVEAVAGSNFGFPSCPAKPSMCSNFTKPFAQFPAHSSAMGLAPLGGRLYVSLFSGTGKGPEVVSMPIAGGVFTPFLTGFVAPVVALGAHGGAVFCGDLTGAVYRVKA
jgi:glucose/arabinose dehydrogenase